MSSDGYCLLQSVLENPFLGRKVMVYVAEWWTMGSFVRKLGLEYDCELPIGKHLFPVIDGAGNGQRRRPASFLIVDDELSDRMVGDKECRADVLVRELLFYYCELNDYLPVVICDQKRSSIYQKLVPPVFVHDTNDLMTQIEEIKKVVQRCEVVTWKNQEGGYGIGGIVLIIEMLGDYREHSRMFGELERIIMTYRHIDLVPIIVSRRGYFQPMIRVNLDFVCLFPPTYTNDVNKLWEYYGANFFNFAQFMGIMNGLIPGDGMILDNVARSREGAGALVWKNRHFSSNLIGSRLTRLSKYFKLS